ncbi:MAG TPA: hypothetical protein VMM36_10505 [Opitutaceae bacterium]|nr:hypothetical protein [Opitutaceae bacterium]
MAESVPHSLLIDANRKVLAHIAMLSAHSDIAGILRLAVSALGDVKLFCPDWNSYRYVVAYTDSIIFGVALGMDTVAFRLDPRMKQRALATGGVAIPECGDEWVAVVHRLHDSDWPAVDATFWARKAYAAARASRDERRT